MERSANLDNIAPDDLVVETKPVSHKKTKKLKKHKKKIIKASPCLQDRQTLHQKIYDILGKSSRHHTTFSVAPQIFNFAERQKDEEIFLALRPHWVRNLKWIVIALIMMFLPLITSSFDLLDFLPTKYIFISILFWYLVTFIYIFEKFLHWYFNVFIVTNERVVDIDFNNMINKHFAEADIRVIQDISFTVKGVFGTFFNYGNILIQTASHTNQILFEDVSNPNKVVKVLQELRDFVNNVNKES